MCAEEGSEEKTKEKLVMKEIFLLQASFSKSQEGELIKEFFFEEDDYRAFIYILIHLFISWKECTMHYELPL